MIDPQLQGIRWIKNKESAVERHLEVCRPGQKDLVSDNFLRVHACVGVERVVDVQLHQVGGYHKHN